MPLTLEQGGTALKMIQTKKKWHPLMWVPTILATIATLAEIPFVRVPFMHGIYDVFTSPGARMWWGIALGILVSTYMFIEDCIIIGELFSESGWYERNGEYRRRDDPNCYWRLSKDDWDPLFRALCNTAHPRRNCWLFLASQLLIFIWIVGLFG